MSATFESTTTPKHVFKIDRLGYLFCGGCVESGRADRREGTVDITDPNSSSRVDRDETCDGCGKDRSDWLVTEVPATAIVEHFTAKIF